MMKTEAEAPRTDLPDDAALAKRARDIFRAACEGTDSYHALRLGLARRNALQAGRRGWFPRVWAPVIGSAACAALALGVVYLRPAVHDAPIGPVASISANGSAGDEVIADAAEGRLEMVQNLEFYQWLSTQPTQPKASR